VQFVTKPVFNPTIVWVNKLGQLSGEAQRLLRQLIDVTFNRTGLETSKVVTGTAGASGRLAEWDANGDLITADAATIGTSLAFAPTTGGIVGTPTNNNAAAGIVGEYIEGSLASGSATSLTTATAKTVCSMSLTAGDWDVSGVAGFIPAATTSVTLLVADISLTDNALDGTLGAEIVDRRPAYVPTNNLIIAMPTHRTKLTATTTVYLVLRATFTVSTMTGFGLIRARRVR
jgi:hypothetical protein